MKYLFFYMALLILCHTFYVVAQDTPENEVSWEENKDLNWQDFKGTPEVKSNFSAVSATYIETTHGCNGEGKFAYSVRAAFVKNQSWTRDHHSEGLLGHEQLHFDLTEYFARKMRQELAQIPNPCDQSLEKIKTIIDSLYTQMEDAHELYDIYTQHGLDHEQQHAWDDYIAIKLEKLKDYQNPQIIYKKKEDLTTNLTPAF